ncbi:patatin-like phospholipase family protein [Nocardia tenerifensis]|uniref:patatin-like phospholipase family protein n=1 Tax=Nocardia tenerifensis TaxID=228006 RepID=UPI000594A082|nr:patatin-like phospholipase family protein [Nocardia tenerifensis]
MSGRAAVLGPGGVVGTAWSLGVAEGLRRNDIELGEADLLVGTSAGAIAAVGLTDGRDLNAYAEHPASGAAPIVDPAVTAAVFEVLRGAGADPASALRRVGKLASNARTSPEQVHVDRMRALVAARDWPHPNLLIPTVDVDSGEPKVWRGADGVPAYLAVAASTAMPGTAAPVTIGARRYMDGALRNGSNADLAEGSSALVLIEPLAHVFPRTTSSVSRIARIAPDVTTIDIFGPDLADRSNWPAAFAAGLRQGAAAASEVRSVWSR